ncbi:hypothetical protein, partial [Streptomyces sp. SID6139]|uniref:hypothetical protein n=1 Tax=Streptomyces sp. SID6139 TaxID=2690320 RepID=UPI001F233A40
HRRPRTGSAGISGAIRSHIASVITNRTDTSDQLMSPPKRHGLGPAAYKQHTGSKPMSITWRLENDLPADVWTYAAINAG